MTLSVSWPKSARPAVLTVFGLLAGVACIVLFYFDPRQYHFYPVLRGLHQLLHGHLAAAFRFNPMLIVSLPFLCWFGAKYWQQQARNQSLSLGLRPVWLWLLLGAVLVVSVLRNLPGTPFAMLRP
jgi:sterol desaturase/sphingolipid hydroxylase (fatty acid hydroxylase superfamily)